MTVDEGIVDGSAVAHTVVLLRDVLLLLNCSAVGCGGMPRGCDKYR